MSTDDIRPPADALPAIDEARIDEIEDALFGAIAAERAAQVRARSRRAHTRRRAWWVTAAAAAVVVVGAVATPAVLQGLGHTTSGGAALAPARPIAPALPGAKADRNTDSAVSGSGSDAGSRSAGPSITTRQIVTTATATVQVGDVADAARRVAAAAQKAGGYVAGMAVGDSATSPPLGEGSSGAGQTTGGAAQSGDAVVSAPRPPAGGGWITVRVPAGALNSVVADLASLGTVQASAVNRADVTDQSIDLQARIDALQASVTRLTELMTKAGSVADLVAAESALSDRQATLESYQQQLAALKGQVALSTLTVTLVPKPAAATADPAGFGTGLAAGWAGLVAALNGLVIGIGFLLPWLAVTVLVAVVVWVIVRAARRRRQTPADATAPLSDD